MLSHGAVRLVITAITGITVVLAAGDYNPALTVDGRLPIFNPISSAPPPDLFERVVHPLTVRNVDPSGMSSSLLH
jgi:hypothetical protein